MEFLLLLALPLLAFAFGGTHSSDDPSEDSAINGTDGADTIHGDPGDDTILGNDGNDQLVGHAGDDSLRGGFGNDIVDGSEGNDFAQGGAGNDLVLGFTGDDTLDGGRGDDAVLGEAGNDLIHLGSGNDTSWIDDEVSKGLFLNGQLGDDTIFGDAGNDNIWDYSGHDALYGGDGDDRMSATDNQLADWNIAPHAADTLFGGAGNDLLIGDDGDTLTGGTGNDSFTAVSFGEVDRIVQVDDYNGDDDSITLDLADEGLTAGDWSLVVNTDATTGDVSLGVANVSDPSVVMNYALLKAPANFTASQVQLFWR